MLQNTTDDIEKAPELTRVIHIYPDQASASKFVPISNPEAPHSRQIWMSLIWLALSILSCGLYGVFLSHILGAHSLVFWPAIEVCLPLVFFTPIFQTMFKTELGPYVLVINLMMTWADIPIIFLNSSIAQYASKWVVAYLNAGLLEEILKGLVYLIPVWMGRIRYGYQVICYAAIAGLMFGVGENVLYAVQFIIFGDSPKLRNSEIIGSSVVDILIQYRVFTTALLHVLLTVLGACIVAYTLTGLWSLSNRSVACFLAIFVSAFLHGTYDAFLMNFDGKYSWVSKVTVGLTVVSVLALLLYMRSRQLTP